MTLTECAKRTAQVAIASACQQGWIVQADGHTVCRISPACWHQSPQGVAPERMPKADATELAPKKIG